MEQTLLENFRNIFFEMRENYLKNQQNTLEDWDVKTAGDDVEVAKIERERELDIKMKGRDRFIIKKIEIALTKIENGTFGRCDDCEQSIELDRLKARPMANLCIDCKESQEREESKIPYHKKSHTLGKGFSNSHVSKLEEVSDENNLGLTEKNQKFLAKVNQ